MSSSVHSKLSSVRPSGSIVTGSGSVVIASGSVVTASGAVVVHVCDLGIKVVGFVFIMVELHPSSDCSLHDVSDKTLQKQGMSCIHVCEVKLYF